MNRQQRAWQVSLGLHAALIGSFALLSLSMTTIRRPVVIDLSLGGTSTRVQAAPAAALPRPVPRQRAPSPPPKSEAVPTPLQPRVTESTTPELQAPIPAPIETPAPVAETAAIAGATAEVSVAANEALATGTPGSGNETAAEKEQIYLREHFTYIRNLIMKELGYPPLAQRMGWSGQVIVSFVVQEDGSVDKLTVVKGSGRPLLDQNALATISRVAPFPQPPISAEIVMPIAYQLR